MNLQLLSTHVENLSLYKVDVDNVQEIDNHLNLQYGNAFSEQTTNTFQVFFELEIYVKKDCKLLDIDQKNVSHKMEIKFIALFRTDESIKSDFRNSDFPKVNAPAIAYPFLRSFIGTFLLNGGFEPVLLPSFNFSEAAKSKSVR